MGSNPPSLRPVAPRPEFVGLPQAADLYGDIGPTPRRRWADLLPGLGIALLALLAAGFIADRYGAPLTLMALLVGLALNFLAADLRLTPGLGFASRELLRLAVILMGARITFAQMGDLGLPALGAVVVVMASGLAAAVMLARWRGAGGWFGLLSGGAVAVCGASAALALAAALGPRRAPPEALAAVLVVTAGMSAFAMLVWPALAHALALSDAQAGFLFGAAIHDVAQSIGAGFGWSAEAGEVSTIVKLARVALLAPLVGIAVLLVRRAGDGPGGRAELPWFVGGFLLLVLLNSLGALPALIAGAAAEASTWLLALAVAATAMRAPLGELRRAGATPLIVTGGATLVALGVSLAAAAALL
jgi:uncharacterized integral membrane protein (TIGR00698 family)